MRPLGNQGSDGGAAMRLTAWWFSPDSDRALVQQDWGEERTPWDRQSLEPVRRHTFLI